MWIELHETARAHPKTIKLARRLAISKVQALGHLCSLWTWTLGLAPDGDLSSFDADDIEIGAQWDGDPGAFVSAAEDLKLLDRTEYGLVIHDWEDFSGSLKAAKRARDYRARKRGRTAPSRDGAALSRDITQTRPDQTRPDQNDQTRPERPDTKPPVSLRDTDRIDDVRAVFAHYRTHHPRAIRNPKSNSKEWRLIRNALRSRSVDELCLAIDGNHKDPFCCGQNSNGKTYHRLDLVFRDESHIADYIEIAEKPREPVFCESTRKTIAAGQEWLAEEEENDRKRQT